jgi:ribonuclease P protein component
MLGRLVHSRDFERMRTAGTWSRSTHFAVHHLPERPASPKQARPGIVKTELSTKLVTDHQTPVDNCADTHWLGTVLPKRLARRAVTRNLLRRQIREAMRRHVAALPPGLWVVRLRAAFARSGAEPAASLPLRRTARTELDGLLGHSARRTA